MSFDDHFAADVLETCVDALGGEVLYQPEIGAEGTILGIWSRPYVEQGEGETVRAGYTPTLGIKLEHLREALEVDGPVVGDHVVREGQRYRVRHFEPDGQGGCTLFLHEVSTDE